MADLRNTANLGQANGNKAKSGLIGKLLLPGYTDAGSSTAFRPISEEHEADALTEVCDNRSSNKAKIAFTRDGRSSIHNTSINSNSNRSENQFADKHQQQPHHQRESAADSNPADAKCHTQGFFPSTNPISSSIGHATALPKQQQNPESSAHNAKLSPDSPPVVARKHFPTPSLAGTSTVPETGGSFSLSTLAYPSSSSATTDRKQLEPKEETLTSEALGCHLRKTQNEQGGGGGGGDKQRREFFESQLHRRLHIQLGKPQKESAYTTKQGGDATTTKIISEAHDSTTDSDVFSDVNSTASEMGTVIQMGYSRMDDVQAMAALIEASPSYQDDDEQEHDYTNNNTNNNDEYEDEGAKKGLSVPALEHHSRNESSAPNNVATSRLPSSILRQRKETSSVAPLGLDSAVMSAAIRRIGSGIGNSAKHQSTSSPVPNTSGTATRPRVEELLKSTLSPQRVVKSSQALSSSGFVSPGSARYSALKEREISSQQLETGRKHSGDTLQTLDSRALGDKSSKNSSILSETFRFAQKCFSFDSTLDEYAAIKAANPYYDREEAISTTPRDRTLRHSRSWDVGGSSLALKKSKPSDSSRLHTDLLQNASVTKPSLFRDTSSGNYTQRERFYSDFSPCKTNAMELQTPQRIELEREDALDILACLVQRGIALHGAEFSQDPERGKAILRESSNCQTSQDYSRIESQQSSNKSTKNVEGVFGRSDSPDSLMKGIVDELRNISKAENPDDESDHNARMAVLDELLRSHAYALEMKRAALSASTWLRSIGRSDSTADMFAEDDERESRLQVETRRGQSSGEDDREDTTACSEKIELLSLRALLHNAQCEAREKAEMANKLNEELSKCRAEIGRLKSASRPKTMILSPNVSILDDDNENESASTSIAESLRRDHTTPSPIKKVGSENEDDKKYTSSYSKDDSLFKGLSEERKETFNEEDRLDLLVMKSALDVANSKIRQLHSELENHKPTASEPPVVEFPDVVREFETGADNRTVNVRMLDGENFVTEWGDLTPPLPPPPDHGLRSPIVGAVLQQWTTDRSLHDSLFAWMERVMTGNDLEMVPPLTISSLDHQVRDGFTMHVLPLVLRRADVHVAVQTRAHRRTTYDLAVTVDRKYESNPFPGHDPGFLERVESGDVVDDWSRSDFEKGSTTHSAVTAHITNAGRHSPTNYREGPFGRSSDLRGGMPGTHVENGAALHQQHGIMSALGGALGGLLSRRKHAGSSPSRYVGGSGSRYLPPSLRAQLDLTSSPVFSAYSRDEEQPYHRVVSAPPGRIGVTFVEFRGHAMVSDVSPNSPLSGWVFPSDILIAIDEVPVSGMRVRDIIKVLTTRKSRQRALRVISSHAMNEFTLNSSRLDMAEDDPP